MSELLPTLPGYVSGIVGRDPWRVQCQECGHLSEDRLLLLAIRKGDLAFHRWPDGTNPRLCRQCRLSRDCPCHRCECERQGTDYPTCNGKGAGR